MPSWPGLTSCSRSPTRPRRRPQVTMHLGGAWASVTPPWRTFTGSGQANRTRMPSPKQGGTSSHTIVARNNSIAGPRIFQPRPCSFSVRTPCWLPWRKGSPPIPDGVPRHPAASSVMALRIATAADGAERDRLKAKLRKRMPLHLFRWMHHGHYDDVAFMLHAVFPRPEGPPSRLIERAWDFMPEIERRPEA